jgi:uncharacterized phage protein gp47/JayE
MANIVTKSLAQITASFQAAAQASAAQVLDFSVGSVFLALAEAGGALGLWLQKLALQAVSLARFATSYGADADSWGAQFQFVRLPATQATGSVTFTIAAGVTPPVVPVGTVVQTADGTLNFAVYADPTNSAYSATAVAGGGYIVPAGASSVSVPVQAQTAGSAGNVIAGAISVPISTISGIASVSNPAGFANALDAETDTAYKARFPNYLAGLARANRAAIVAAIESVQQGLTYALIENELAAGAALPYYDVTDWFDRPGGFAYPTLVPWPGVFVAIVDDGSGSPPAALLIRISQAIDAVRGLGIQYAVLAPWVVTADVSMTLVAATGYSHAGVAGAAATALQNWLNTQPLGTPLVPLTRLSQVVYDAVAGVATIAGATINGQAADLMLNQVQIVRAGVIAVN